MEIFLYNFEFMLLNLFLALIPVVFGYYMLKTKKPFLRFLFGFLWFVFLPNTAYILLDIVHLYEEWSKVGYVFKLILIAQYAIFFLSGVITFIIAVNFFEKLIAKKSKHASNPKQKRKFETSTALMALNFLVGFGVIMGYVQRTNSWHVVTHPLKVFEDIQTILFSPNLILASLVFGLIANIIYFYFSKPLIKFEKTLK